MQSDSKLREAFKLFDKNNDGAISAQEIKAVLGRETKAEDNIWEKVVNEVDKNGDGKVFG